MCIFPLIKKKSPVKINKLRTGTHQQKYKVKRTQVDTTQRKTKANNQQKWGDDRMQRGLMAIKCQSTAPAPSPPFLSLVLCWFFQSPFFHLILLRPISLHLHSSFHKWHEWDLCLFFNMMSHLPTMGPYLHILAWLVTKCWDQFFTWWFHLNHWSPSPFTPWFGHGHQIFNVFHLGLLWLCCILESQLF